MSLLDEPVNAAAIAHGHQRVRAARAAVETLEREALDAFAAGDAARGVGLAQATVRLAAATPSGLLAFPALERALLETGRERVLGRLAPPDAGPRERCVHVLTEAYELGGHTRLVRRWIELDRARTHDVVLTTPTGSPPAWLEAAVAASGGTLLALDPAHPPLDRAAALRGALSGADLVVLHAHMWDAVALLALAEPAERPPTLLMDHADHCAWLGTGVAGVVCEFRPSALAVSARARGVDPDRQAVVPIPLATGTAQPSRDGARAALGLEPDRPVALTVASAYKFAPFLEPAFPALAAAAVQAAGDGAIVLAVGPREDPVWAVAKEATGGRVLALGPQRDIGPFLAAADLYLDAWPCASGTSALEASQAGLPTLRLVPDAARLGLLTGHDLRVPGEDVEAADAARYVDAATRLLTTPGASRERAQRIRAHVRHRHAGPGWLGALENAIARARAMGPVDAPPATDRTREADDWEALHAVLHHAGGQALDPQQALAAVATDLPPRATGRTLALVPTDRRGTFALVDALRARGGGTVVAPPARLDAAVADLEAALADGADVDVELVPAETVEELAGRGDTVLVVDDGAVREAVAA